MIRSAALEAIDRAARSGQGLSLFLDYDGTLAPLGSRAALAGPDEGVLRLLAELAQTPACQTIILSGRTRAALAQLLPIPTLTLAGIYGLEVQMDGQEINRGPALLPIRPVIAWVRSNWAHQFDGDCGVVIEDKVRSVALHASGAKPGEAAGIVQTARQVVADWLPPARYRFIGEGDYLEVVPAAADKAQTVDWFLDQRQRRPSLPVYFGDDANDDAAFAAVRRRGGLTIGVGKRHAFQHAVEVIDSPAEVRIWLEQIVMAARRRPAAG